MVVDQAHKNLKQRAFHKAQHSGFVLTVLWMARRVLSRSVGKREV